MKSSAWSQLKWCGTSHKYRKCCSPLCLPAYIAHFHSLLSNSPLIFSQLAVNTYTYLICVYYLEGSISSLFPSKICCIEIHQGSFITLIMVKSSKGALNDVLMAARRRIISEVLYCTSAALIPSTLHWDEVPFRWKRKWWVCLCVYSSEHALNLQSHSERRRGKYIGGSVQEDGFSCHCNHQPRHCLLQHIWATGVSVEQLQTGEPPPTKVQMELSIKVPLTQPSIFRLDGLLWP